ncbi:MAG: hypothetical protein HOC71_10855 [Candidatus Latescibacteria bacterium]|nr:hypothetical protein [Candidatus Latescibacterota bacterium]
MMLYHRAIGQPISIEVADELGILTYEEPGGYMCNPGSDKPIEERMAPVPSVAKAWRREKLRRMILRDRSVPSMSIWNMDDLSWLEPTEDDIKNIRLVHELDPSRPVTFNCIIPAIVPNIKDNPLKLHMKSFDDTLYYHGWISPYHFASQAGYVDEYYQNPRYYLRYVLAPHSHAMGDSIHPAPEDEIIFYGEEGGYGTPQSLEKIKNELMRTGADGWREGEHLNWYDSYDRFLDESGFRSSFPTVDDLTMALGVNLHYFHGRIIENTRISNKADAYVLNGWASAGTHTDIVDTYRNPTADTGILKHYTRPLYVAVKIRDKVLPVGTIPVADIFIVNEKNLRGKHTLALSFENPSGNIVFSEIYRVNILGGEEFGQLLVENVHLPRVEKNGYYTLRAKITDRKNTVKATGHDDIFTVDYMNGPGIKGTVTVIDTSGTIKSFLKETRGLTISDFDPYGPDIDYIIIGKHDLNMVRRLGKSHVRGPDPIMTRVANGATLIVLDQADRWAELRGNINLYRAIHYVRSSHLGDRGRLFTGKSNLLRDLPNSQALNWEYQVFYSGDVWGLNMDRQGNETVVALAAQHNKDILTALSRIPFGNGQIILSTLNILPELSSEKYQSAVAKKLFLNLLEYSR